MSNLLIKISRAEFFGFLGWEARRNLGTWWYKVTICTIFSIVGSTHSSMAISLLPSGTWFFTAGGAMHYNSNLRSNAGGGADHVLSLNTNANYRTESKYYQGSLGVGVVVRRYGKNKEFDDEGLVFNFNLSPTEIIGGKRLRFRSDTSFSRQSRSSSELGNHFTSDNLDLSFGVDYDINRDFTIGVSTRYGQVFPDSPQLFDYETYGGGIEGAYHWSKHFSMTAGFRYSESTAKQQGNSQDGRTTVSAGLRTRLTEKITGHVRFGMQMRQSDQGGSDSSPHFDVDLIWRIDDRNSLQVDARQEFGSNEAAQNTDSTNYGIHYSRQLTKRMSASIGARLVLRSVFRQVELREDKDIAITSGLDWALSKRSNISWRLDYTKQISDSVFFEYDSVQMDLNYNYRF